MALDAQIASAVGMGNWGSPPRDNLPGPPNCRSLATGPILTPLGCLVGGALRLSEVVHGEIACLRASASRPSLHSFWALSSPTACSLTFSAYVPSYISCGFPLYSMGSLRY